MVWVSQDFSTLEVPVIFKSDANIQYLCMLVRGESLRQFDTLSAEVVSSTPENLRCIILGLGNFFNVNAFPKKKCAMRLRMSNPCSLKVRC